MWFYFALLAALFFAAMNTCFAWLMAQGMGLDRILAWTFISCFVSSFALGLAHAGPAKLKNEVVRASSYAKWFAATMILGYFGNRLSIYSQSCAPNPGYSVSVNSATQALLAIAIGWIVFNAKVKTSKIVGVAATAIGIAVIRFGEPVSIQSSAKGGFIVAAMSSAALFTTIAMGNSRIGKRGVGLPAILLWCFGTGFLPFAFSCWYQDLPPNMPLHYAVACACGVFSCIANLFALSAFRLTPNEGLVIGLMGVQSLFVMAGAQLLLKRGVSTAGLVGIAICLIGIFLLRWEPKERNVSGR